MTNQHTKQPLGQSHSYNLMLHAGAMLPQAVVQPCRRVTHGDVVVAVLLWDEPLALDVGKACCLGCITHLEGEQLLGGVTLTLHLDHLLSLISDLQAASREQQQEGAGVGGRV